MVILSCLRYARPLCSRTVANNTSKELLKSGDAVKSCKRYMGGGARKMILKPTGFEWKVFKDEFHFYFMMGAGVTVAFITYFNLVDGPAELAEIPEGYQPKPWEYHKDPVERFMAKYIFPTPEKQYERNLHCMYLLTEYEKMSKMERHVQEHMKNNTEFKGWYYSPTPTKQLYDAVIEAEGEEDRRKL